MKTPSPTHIQNLTDLQHFMREALKKEHPEWVGADGGGPVLQDYQERFEKLLKMAVRPEATVDLGLAA